MALDYFYGQAGELFSFYRIPKALFQEPRFQSLSTDAKTLYGILLDRMSLSMKNGWLDEQNRVFIIFTMLKKIVLFPISLFVAFLALMARWLLTLSSYVVAPLMLYIFGCGIYTVYRQTWNQFFILLVAEFICFILFFGATAITEGIGRFSEWLAEQ